MSVCLCANESVDCFIAKSEPIVSVLEKVDSLLSLPFLFLRLGTLSTQDTGDRAFTHEAEPKSDKPNGISLKNDGIQKRP